MMRPLKKFLIGLVDPTLVIPSARVALIVGSMLFVINHLGAVAHDQMSAQRWFSALLTYCVPYLVSIHGRVFSAKSQA